ncbi:MAG TPA: hypothetical protein ENH01_06560 [Nitrospirae bacterium]|nr:hypothetical protein [Nitrospirota bacterium]
MFFEELLQIFRKRYVLYNRVDFYYISGGKEHLLNVSYDLESPATKEREIRGLVEAMEKLSIKEGSIITAEHKELLKTGAGKIHIVPLWEWLLNA